MNEPVFVKLIRVEENGTQTEYTDRRAIYKGKSGLFLFKIIDKKTGMGNGEFRVIDEKGDPASIRMSKGISMEEGDHILVKTGHSMYIFTTEHNITEEEAELLEASLADYN